MLDANIRATRQVHEDYKLEIPKKIRDAEAIAATANKVLAEVTNQTEPQITDLTATNAAAIHKRLIDWENRAPAIAAAKRLADYANSEAAAAWDSTPELMEQLRDPFNEAAEKFTATGDTKAREELERLASARDRISRNNGAVAAVVAAYGAKDREPLTRYVTTPSKMAAVGLAVIQGARYRTERWWDEVRLRPGHTIEWNTPAEQIELWESIPKETPADTVTALVNQRVARKQQRRAAAAAL